MQYAKWQPAKKGIANGNKLNIVEVSHELHFATFDLICYSNVKYLIGLLTENQKVRQCNNTLIYYSPFGGSRKPMMEEMRNGRTAEAADCWVPPAVTPPELGDPDFKDA